MDRKNNGAETNASEADITRNNFDLTCKWAITCKPEGFCKVLGIDYDPDSMILSTELPVISSRMKVADYVLLTPAREMPKDGAGVTEAKAGGHAKAAEPLRKYDFHLNHFEFDGDGKDVSFWRYMTYATEIARRHNELSGENGKPADITTFVVYSPSVAGSPLDGYGSRDSSLRFDVRQIFLSRLIDPDGVIERCRGRLRNLSGASKKRDSVPDDEFVSLTLTTFFFKNRPEWELKDFIGMVLKLSCKISDPLLAASVLTAGKNLTDVSPFTEEFSRMFKDDVADFMSDGKYSAALKTAQKLERRVAEEKRRVAEEKRRVAEEKRRVAVEKRRVAEEKKRADEERTARLEAEKRVRELEEAAALSKKGSTGPGGGPDKQGKYGQQEPD